MSKFIASLILLNTILSTSITLADTTSTNYHLFSEPVGVIGAWGTSDQFDLFATIGMPPLVSNSPITTPAGYSLITGVSISELYSNPIESQTLVLSFNKGWNLASSRINVDPDQSFGDSPTFLSLWKWTNNKWAVRLPSQIDDGQSYANSKGFDFLSTILPGEGFWVNSSKIDSVNVIGVPIPPQPPMEDPVFQVPGWHLVGLMNDQPLIIEGLSDNIKLKIISLWKWENDTWSVCLPGEKDNGASYATSKGFSQLTDIDPGEGFWVNVQ